MLVIQVYRFELDPNGRCRSKLASFKVTTGVFGVTDARHVRLPRIGVICTKEPTAKLAGLLDVGAGRVLSATVSQQAGCWYVAFGVEVTRLERRPAAGLVVGVDVGVRSLAVLFTGEVVENPKHLSRCQRGKLPVNAQGEERFMGSPRCSSTNCEDGTSSELDKTVTDTSQQVAPKPVLVGSDR